MLKALNARDGFLFVGLAMAATGIWWQSGGALALIFVGAVFVAVGLLGALRRS